MYKLTDRGTGEAPEVPYLYEFLYQWQYTKEEEKQLLSDPDSGKATPSRAGRKNFEAEEGWVDLAGENTPVYSRPVETGGTTLRFRCVVTAVKLTRERSAGQITMYSEPVNALAELSTVYVAQTKGNDANSGADQDHPVKTLKRAAELLKTRGEGGTAENNQIILVEDYIYNETQTWEFLEDRPVPVTIRGMDDTNKVKLSYNYITPDVAQAQQETNINLHEDLIFDSIELKLMHIYANGYDIKICKDVVGSNIYLYGSARTNITDQVGKIEVYGGNYARIAGYVRSNPMVDVVGKEANITVGGTANVTTVIAGSASGGIENAIVNITVMDEGTVGTLVGSCQGFSNAYSPYSGTTTINIKGGKVTNIYGAGSGRTTGIPKFLGDMNINVSGGQVGNIYGSGSAAYVISTAERISNINISASGGTIGNIYAAGIGGDVAVEGGSQNETKPERITLPEDFGSLTGTAKITISGNAVVTGNIYASGQGFQNTTYDTSKNAYLKGTVQINIEGGTINQNVFGGGKGIDKAGYEDCARIVEGSTVKIQMTGGTVKGNIYGGGEIAKVYGSTSVTVAGKTAEEVTVEGDLYGGGKNAPVTGSTSIVVSGGTIKGYIYGGGENASVGGSANVTLSGGLVQKNIYGGGKQGLVEERTNVTVSSGTVNSSVYGGALGVPGERFVKGGSTVNMSGGWVRGNLYGGSELSDDGPELSAAGTASAVEDLIFVNLTGGAVSGKVFGGGYQGIINGSTHVHVGVRAMDKCNYYKSHPSEKPSLTAAELSVGGSVYAGGDYGDGVDYNAITIKGFSHVYIDGEGYSFGGAKDGSNGMNISGGVFGSGASCDAGDKRLVTLDHYGVRTGGGSGQTVAVSSILTSIQRADQVRLINSHVRLSGQSDVANANQTALYSLNRIGDQGEKDGLGELGNGLILVDGSTLILDSASIELANFKSVESVGQGLENWKNLEFNRLLSVQNTVMLTTGTVFRISSTPKGGVETYGAVSGYTYMMAEDAASAYAYARIKTATDNREDGGFAIPGEDNELPYTNVEESGYRYWRIAGEHASATRETVLTAQKLDNAPEDGFSIATGSIELPPAEEDSTYKIGSIMISGSMTLADAAKTTQTEWTAPQGQELQESEKDRIKADPLSTFGLYMRSSDGFDIQAGTVISNSTASSGVGNNSEIVAGAKGSVPKIEFTLTYYNKGITVSQDLGKVVIVIERYAGKVLKETVTLNVEIVTKATALSEQSVDLYATQGGTYTGKLIIPAGMSRTLSLSGVETSFRGDTVLKTYTSATALSGHEISVTMCPVQSQGWQSSGLMEGEFDLSTFQAAGRKIIGSTDSRYEAPIKFTLYNVTGGFESKSEADIITLKLIDNDNSEVPITLKIHWEDSIVTEVKTERGKQYNVVPQGTNKAVVSPDSALTSVFTLGSKDAAQNLWIELQTDGARTALPVGTKLTLLGQGNKFYFYKVTGEEQDGKIPLPSFAQMWNSGNALSGDVGEKPITVVMDFEGSGGLSQGDYSLRLRNDKSADSIGADFTVDNSLAKVSVEADGGDGLSKGKQVFKLSVLSASDTRLSDGAAVAVSSPDGFPEGTVFRCNGRAYYPVKGAVYFMAGGPEMEFVMDTTNSAGLTADRNHSLKIQLFPVGASSGHGMVSAGEITYTVRANPEYGLKIYLADESGRVCAPGTDLSFTASYLIRNEAEAAAIQVETYRKESESYVRTGDWNVSGAGEALSGSGSGTVTVSVPAGADQGTYRLIFRLGDSGAPYNVIVRTD